MAVRYHANQIDVLQVQQEVQNGEMANAVRLRKSAVVTFNATRLGKSAVILITVVSFLLTVVSNLLESDSHVEFKNSTCISCS